MNIYHTDLSTLEEGLENKLMLEAQVKYAMATDHTHLMDSNDMLFEISLDEEAIILTEVDGLEDEDEVEGPSDEEIPESNLDIIDLIIRNSLLSPEPIRKEQADTMLVLAQLKHLLAAS